VNRKRRTLIAVAAVAAACFVGIPLHDSADAAPGDVTITGHGYGHGRGLSQWGAYGYATGWGMTSDQILAHYYGNTVPGDIGNPEVSVRITTLDGVAPRVSSGQNVYAGGYWIEPGRTAQISRNADGTFALTTWYGCTGAFAGGATITDPTLRVQNDPGDDITKMLTVCSTNRTYRGALVLAWDGAMHTVNHLPMQDYLRGVVPRESPASWGDANYGAGMQALKAQAVAARSYAQAESRTSYAKTCDTTSCQVYGGAGVNGARIEDARTDSAVASTLGQVRMLNGAVARTEFTSSSGGYTAPGGIFPAVDDPGDNVSPYYNWSTTLGGQQVGQAFGVGTLLSINVLSRNGLGADGGRVTKVRVTGTGRSVDVTGDAFRSALGLRSDWFSIKGIEPTWTDPTAVDLSPVQPASVRTTAGSVVTFVRGVGNTLWSTTAVNGTFEPFVQLAGAGLTGLAAVSTDGGRVDLFVVGLDKALWHTWTQVDGAGRPTTWAAWESLGGTLTSAPTAASVASGKLMVAGRNTLGGISYRTLDGSTWGGWQSAGGGSVTAPALEFYDASTYRIRVVGTDGVVWVRQVPASGAAPSSAWASSGVPSGFAPVTSGTTSWALDALAEAWPNGAGSVLQVRSNGQKVDLGGGINSAVALVEMADGGFWTFGRGTDGALWVNKADAAGASVWQKVGGYLI
jgi:SpoIID/LytB domain protein